MNLYDFTVTDIKGNTVKLNTYKDYVVLIVNTATKCGFASQFEGLEKLYQTYKDKHFVVLGFPSNQFKNQEPGSREDIQSTCSLNFGVTFPLFDKIDVKGQTQHPLYTWLTKSKPGLFGKQIKWNFTKFLIDSKGRVVKRFSPTTKPQKITSHIESLLKK